MTLTVTVTDVAKPRTEVLTRVSPNAYSWPQTEGASGNAGRRVTYCDDVIFGVSITSRGLCRRTDRNHRTKRRGAERRDTPPMITPSIEPALPEPSAMNRNPLLATCRRTFNFSIGSYIDVCKSNVEAAAVHERRMNSTGTSRTNYVAAVHGRASPGCSGTCVATS